MPQRDASNRLLIENVAVGRAERRRRRDRELLLAPAQLGVVLLDLEALSLQVLDDLVDHARG